ncbi:MAG TPA: peptidylprolyl isomerase [Kofleriaceae bacterium]|nr:peptidylprolyl isomerase [Kofleriaceae bacterium]
MRIVASLTIAVALALTNAACERDKKQSGPGGVDPGSAELMSDLYDIINARETPCPETKQKLETYRDSHQALIDQVSQAYAAAKANPEQLKPIARPIQQGRAALNRFNQRCPHQFGTLLAILDKVTDGEIKFVGGTGGGAEGDPAAAGKGAAGGGDGHGPDDGHGHGSGHGGGGGKGGGDGATATVDGDVRPPVPADLAGYVKDLPGKGKLMAKIETTMGTFQCELFEKQVPMTVANFVGLARGLKPYRVADPRKGGGGEVIKGKPYYDGIIFHRVIPGFMVQTGDPLGVGMGGPGYKFADEFDPSLRHDRPGRMSMANAGPTTNGSQFFITEVPTPQLDNKHSVFGQCDNVELVKKITGVPRQNDRPNTEVSMKKVTIYRK